MKRLGIALSLAAAVCMTAPGATAHDKKIEKAAPKKAKASVEVVFVLDTTGSMGGLIAGAKRKVWSIVNELANGKPTPSIKVGLIPYRDKKDAYVTKVFGLTNDLDKVYNDLQKFGAAGGGDGPEHVNQGLSDAVNKIKWSADKKTLKIVFLVGDAPPHMDYKDDTKYSVTCEKAVRAGIIINTIRCGNNASAGKFWKDIADKSEGKYISIGQSGGMNTVVKTPFDKRIAELGRKLDRGFVAYGRRADREKALAKAENASKKADSADDEAKAARASYRAKMAHAGKPSGASSHSLLDLHMKDADAVDKLDKKKLPDDLAKLSKEDLKKELDKRVADRKKLQKELIELSKKREAHIRTAQRKTGKRNSFDAKVLDMLKQQAKKKGITYEEK